jgi:membrane-bound serine protease (ClpP class)
VRTLRRVLALTFVAPALVSVTVPAAAQGSAGVVIEVPVTGVVDPFLANHVAGTIEDAERDGARAVLLTIDTPGGLGSSMREITQAVLNAHVPVIGYVSPEGARAASAGTFILMACPVAAMAPATNVGAAHPVGLAGAIESEKATNDAAAYLVDIARRNGRNEQWAAAAVRDSASIPAGQALEKDVIDLIAPNVATLFARVDGRTVTVADGRTVTLDLAGATVREEPLGMFVGFLHALFDPNLAFVFFWVGLALIAIEFFVPGGIAGTIGVLLFIASLVTLGSLPVQLIGVGLLVASIVFFVLELLHPGVGVPTVAGVVCVLLGGWFLFDTSVPGVRVSPFVIVPVAAFAAAFFLVVVRAAMRMRHRSVITRDETLVGREGITVRDLDPRGVVRVASEEWTAESTGPPILSGERVRVVAVDGVRLTVEAATSGEPLGEPRSRAIGSPAEAARAAGQVTHRGTGREGPT